MKKLSLILLFIALSEVQLSSQIVIQEEELEVVVYVEEQPWFPGGEAAMNEYFQKNIQYPELAKEMGIEGKVYVGFTVDKTGSVTNVKVLKSVYDLLDKEAVRVVKNMPKWSPGKQNGRAINVKYALPIKFRIK